MFTNFMLTMKISKRFYRNSIRAISLSLAAMMLLALLAGCGDDKKPAASTAAETDDPMGGPVTITLWGFPYGALDGQQPGEWMEKDLIQAWNEQYPDVTVKVELLPFDGIQEKMATAITSKKTPDVFLDTPERILGYANMGVMLPLNDAIPEDKLQKITSNPDIMSQVAVNGDIVTLPWSTGAALMMVNKTLWKNANAEHLLPQNEERTWTPEQFLEALRAVKDEKNGVYGITLFALNEQGDQFYNNVMAGFGVKLFNPEHTRYIAGEDPAALEAMKFFKTIVDEKLSTPFPETLTSTNALDYFKQGKNGMLGAAAGAHVKIVADGLADNSIAAPFEPMLVNYPSTTENQATLRSSLGHGGVFKSGDAKREYWAKKFLIWMHAENDIIFKANRPAYDIWGTDYSAINNEGLTPMEQVESEYLRMVVSKTSEWPIMDTGANIVGFPEMRAAMFPEMQAMFIGRTTPEETLKNISDKFNSIIEKYNP